MANHDETIGRRRLLLVGAGALALFGANACKKAMASTCNDDRGLAPADVQARSALGYVDRSTDPSLNCDLCQQYVPSSIDGQCGGCKVMKGPVHPHGTCRAFTKA